MGQHMDRCRGNHKEGSNISWGGLVAGAAIAGGVLCMGASVGLGLILMGAGLAYLLSDKKPDNHEAHLRAQELDRAFALNEEMRVTQTKMVMQAALAGNPQAQAMLAGAQQGR